MSLPEFIGITRNARNMSQKRNAPNTNIFATHARLLGQLYGPAQSLELLIGSGYMADRAAEVEDAIACLLLTRFPSTEWWACYNNFLALAGGAERSFEPMLTTTRSSTSLAPDPSMSRRGTAASAQSRLRC